MCGVTVSPLATAELETATARIPIEAKCTCARVRHTEGVSKCAHGQGRRARVVHPVSKPAPTSRRSNDGPPLGHAPLTQTQPGGAAVHACDGKSKGHGAQRHPTQASSQHTIGDTTRGRLTSPAHHCDNDLPRDGGSLTVHPRPTVPPRERRQKLFKETGEYDRNECTMGNACRVCGVGCLQMRMFDRTWAVR